MGVFCFLNSLIKILWIKIILEYPWLSLFQEAAGEGIQILLLGNKMDMDEDREVSFKEAEQLAYVGLN